MVDRLAEALTSDFNVRLIADVFYGPERVFKDLPIADDWSLKWDSEARIQRSGTINVQYSSEVADSLSPTEFSDLLAPFGAELNLLLEISVGEMFSQTFLLGRFVITSVPSAQDEFFQFQGRTLVAGSVVQLTVQDRLIRVDRAGFHFEEQPRPGATCWNEIARLTGMQVTRNVADAGVPSGTLYEPKQGGRLDAVQTLAGVLGGKAVVTPDNTVSVLPNAVSGDPVGVLRIGQYGTVLDVSNSMESDGVCNEVVGAFEGVDADGKRVPIYVTAQLHVGRLAVESPYGAYTYYYTDSTPTTQPAAQQKVNALLTQLSTGQTYRVPVKCILDPRVQDGQVWEVEQPLKNIKGRVVNHSYGGDGLMSLTLEVNRPVPQ